jgi:hypothetical protein
MVKDTLEAGAMPELKDSATCPAAKAWLLASTAKLIQIAKFARPTIGERRSLCRAFSDPVIKFSSPYIFF